MRSFEKQRKFQKGLKEVSREDRSYLKKSLGILIQEGSNLETEAINNFQIIF